MPARRFPSPCQGSRNSLRTFLENSELISPEFRGLRHSSVTLTISPASGGHFLHFRATGHKSYRMTAIRSVCGVPVPAEYFCCITHEIMIDPVSAMDGHVYERHAIESWISQHNRSPMTNALLPSKVLVPCHPIKALIQGFLQQHPQVAEECRQVSALSSSASGDSLSSLLPVT